MKFKILPFARSLVDRRAGALALLFAVLFVVIAYAAKQDVTVKTGCTAADNPQISYGAKNSVAVPAKDRPIAATVPGNGSVEWSIETAEDKCTASGATAQCLGLTLTVPTGSVDPTTTAATLTGTAVGNVGDEGFVKLTVTSADATCSRRYQIHIVASNVVGGWGDPHLTTADGVHYDFQSAGEFTALRQKDFELQTRQTPVPSATVPGASEYTGLPVCVAIYTAVALRIGSNQVSYQPILLQPNILSTHDASHMELRVNKQVVTLTDKGIDLLANAGAGGGPIEGRIIPAAGGGIEITDTSGTQVVVTPTFWASQQKWYLNVNVHQASAIEGTMGLTTQRWLPALPDGTSLGQRPRATDVRYQQLYEQFADAWRVTDTTSRFFYAPGTNTATFTLDEWPRFNPQTCAIQGQTSVQPATPAAAAAACAPVTDAAQKADCIFDVTVTGEPGFAQSYVNMQAFTPNGAGFQPVLAGAGGQGGPSGSTGATGGTGGSTPPTTWPWWWWILILIIVVIIIVLIAKKKKTP